MPQIQKLSNCVVKIPVGFELTTVENRVEYQSLRNTIWHWTVARYFRYIVFCEISFCLDPRGPTVTSPFYPHPPDINKSGHTHQMRKCYDTLYKYRYDTHNKYKLNFFRLCRNIKWQHFSSDDKAALSAVSCWVGSEQWIKQSFFFSLLVAAGNNADEKCDRKIKQKSWET